MAQAAKTKATKRGARAKALKPSDSTRHPGETAAERSKRLKRNEYVRNWRANNKAKASAPNDAPTQFLYEPRTAAGTPARESELPPAPPPSALSSALTASLAASLRISSATTLGDVRSALKVLIHAHGRAAETSDHTKGIVSGLQMALSMLG